MDISLLLVLILIIVPSSTLIHEIGHALAARMVQAESIVLSIGRGKHLLQFNFERLQLSIYAIFFMDGLTSSSRAKPYSKSELLWITALGPIFNGITALLLLIVLYLYPNDFIRLYFWYNIWLGIVNLIPFKYKDKHTDGYILYKLITEKLPPNLY
ncbi:M50 family metallopeptidase [Oceanobacillus chungangensis]|uniref:Peptidase M50 domain-containing protein n=1 Tax=Oceanobacillus chungangensis TaxID=1229152 RepID=A0A3D8Q152_9BACI|nr:M50 family metallopeptidase [Oceanobacillus chungangensis]RDW22004.1 hypothetical protein CWR45_00505 [Oceanobacillus chungangensis]